MHVTVVDGSGRTVVSRSAGTIGAKGAQRGSRYWAELTGREVGKERREAGVPVVHVKVKGHLGQRSAVLRGRKRRGAKVLSIRDRTGQPHNGCRRRKARRL